jgi:ubiquinone/menaquinone biosynthesis C-methylase UbiE
MLNPSFSKAMQKSIATPYVAPEEIATRILDGNEAFDTGGAEHRTQAVFGEEIWLKLERAGFGPKEFQGADVLEVCAGTGFLTYHLLQRCRPQHLTVNDISATELSLARQFIGRTYPDAPVNWVLGDMHTVDFGRQFDVIIGNSFVHHFHDVPKVLARFAGMLKLGGVFISLHEPTPMSTVVEGAKVAVWPLAVLAPGFVNDIARARFKGQASSTDLWMFEAEKIKQVARQAGFTKVGALPWGLLRAIVTQRHGLHLSDSKPSLSPDEERRFLRAIRTDALLNRFLPQRCFGSICLICRR